MPFEGKMEKKYIRSTTYSLLRRSSFEDSLFFFFDFLDLLSTKCTSLKTSAH